jgi:hypothetical protein
VPPPNPQLHNRSTYAQIVSQPNSTPLDHHRTDSDSLSHILSNFLSQFQEMFNQLLNQNSLILNMITTLINKLTN